LYSKLGKPQSLCGRVRNTSPPSGFDLLTVHHGASRFTDWAIAAQIAGVQSWMLCVESFKRDFKRMFCKNIKNCPIKGLARLLFLHEVKASGISRQSALRTVRLYRAGNTPGIHFCLRQSRPQEHSAAERITSMKNFSDCIGNWTRDLLAHSAVPQKVLYLR
jgi:hypothetical protein